MKKMSLDHLREEMVGIIKATHAPQWIKKKLLKLYFISPPKIQFALAKFVLKDIVNKSHQEIDELIRH